MRHVLDMGGLGPLHHVLDFLMGKMGFQLLGEPHNLVLGLPPAGGMMDGQRQVSEGVSLVPQSLSVLGQGHHGVHQVGDNPEGKDPVKGVFQVFPGAGRPAGFHANLGQEDQGGHDPYVVRAPFELLQGRFQVPLGLAYFSLGPKQSPPVIGEPGKIEGLHPFPFLGLPSLLVKHPGLVEIALRHRQVSKEVQGPGLAPGVPHLGVKVQGRLGVPVGGGVVPQGPKQARHQVVGPPDGPFIPEFLVKFQAFLVHFPGALKIPHHLNGPAQVVEGPGYALAVTASHEGREALLEIVPGLLVIRQFMEDIAHQVVGIGGAPLGTVGFVITHGLSQELLALVIIAQAKGDMAHVVLGESHPGLIPGLVVKAVTAPVMGEGLVVLSQGFHHQPQAAVGKGRLLDRVFLFQERQAFLESLPGLVQVPHALEQDPPTGDHFPHQDTDGPGGIPAHPLGGQGLHGPLEGLDPFLVPALGLVKGEEAVQVIAHPALVALFHRPAPAFPDIPDLVHQVGEGLALLGAPKVLFVPPQFPGQVGAVGVLDPLSFGLVLEQFFLRVKLQEVVQFQVSVGFGPHQELLRQFLENRQGPLPPLGPRLPG